MGNLRERVCRSQHRTCFQWFQRCMSGFFSRWMQGMSSRSYFVSSDSNEASPSPTCSQVTKISAGDDPNYPNLAPDVLYLRHALTRVCLSRLNAFAKPLYPSVRHRSIDG